MVMIMVIAMFCIIPVRERVGREPAPGGRPVGVLDRVMPAAAAAAMGRGDGHVSVQLHGYITVLVVVTVARALIMVMIMVIAMLCIIPVREWLCRESAPGGRA